MINLKMQYLHELTMLYLTNSGELKNAKTPEDYAQIYSDVSKRILRKYLEINQQPKSQQPHHGLISRGIDH